MKQLFWIVVLTVLLAPGADAAADGIEQGFLIETRPDGAGPLCVAAEIGGGLRPEFREETGDIDLLDANGAAVLRYGGLHVFDAEGDELPSWLAVSGAELAIHAEDDGASYPKAGSSPITAPRPGSRPRPRG
jgi:hypothetical protein